MAHTCAGRVFCTHVFRQGFGRPHSRARVKEARPLFLLLLMNEVKQQEDLMSKIFNNTTDRDVDDRNSHMGSIVSILLQ